MKHALRAPSFHRWIHFAAAPSPCSRSPPPSAPALVHPLFGAARARRPLLRRPARYLVASDPPQISLLRLPDVEVAAAEPSNRDRAFFASTSLPPARPTLTRPPPTGHHQVALNNSHFSKYTSQPILLEKAMAMCCSKFGGAPAADDARCSRGGYRDPITSRQLQSGDMANMRALEEYKQLSMMHCLEICPLGD